MNEISHARAEADMLPAQIEHYRRQGYVLLRNLLGPRHVTACLQALEGLASGAIPARDTVLMYEAGTDPEALAPGERVARIRKYMDFTLDAPVLGVAAMSRRLHAVLDAILGQGRLLMQEMALVKPPLIGSEKPWHQDAAYFRIADPGHVVGVWIALDPALTRNGCMELVPGSHLRGGVAHVHENDFNRCRIPIEHVRVEDSVAIEMQPGDALVFHALLQHYTAPNASPLRRRALQFHYQQIGAQWCDVAAHARHFHDAHGAYAGCTVPHPGGGGNYSYREGLLREIVPVDTGA